MITFLRFRKKVGVWMRNGRRILWYNMSSTLGLLFFALFAISSRSVLAITVNVSEPGTLEEVVDNIDDSTIPVLSITGMLNGIDIQYLRAQSGRLALTKTLDLSGTAFVEDGTAYASMKTKVNDGLMSSRVTTYYYSSEYNRTEWKTINMLGGIDYTVIQYCNDCSGMFYQTSYEEVVLPDNIREIGEYAFYDCPKLRTVTGKQPFESVGKEAFYKCSSLETFDMSLAHNVGSGAFSDCENFCASADSTLVLTSADNIGDRAFMNCLCVRRIRFSPSLSDIKDNTFSGCKGLESFEFPDKLKSIGSNAFYYCTNLPEISLPASLERLESGAFVGCSSLVTVAFSSVPSGISLAAFEGTPFAQSLQPDEDGITYIMTVAVAEKCSYEGPVRLEFREGTTDIANNFRYGNKGNVTGIEIPSSVRRIGNEAFSGLRIWNGTELNLHEGLEEIGARAFENTDICGVKLPESLLAIGDEAFRGCQNVEGEMTIPENIVKLGNNVFEGCNIFKIIFYPKNCEETSNICKSAERLVVGSEVRCLSGFSYSQLKKVTFEERTGDDELLIGVRTFDFCRNLASLSLPKGKIVIGDYALSDCNELTDFVCEGVVTRIGTEAFRGTGITAASFRDGLEYVGKAAFKNCDKLKTVSLGKTLKYIDDEAFYGNTVLEEVYLGECLDSVGSSAFLDCKSLRSVTLPETLKSLGSKYTFWNCSLLASINIPSSITKLGENCFGHCASLKQIEIPSTVTEIAEGCFMYCSSLEHVVIPESVCTISESCFLECSSLASVSIPASVTSIGRKAFENCNQLKSVVIPSSVLEIGDNCFFSYKSSLVDVYCFSPMPPKTVDSAFGNNTFQNATLHVLENSIAQYKHTYPWYNFQNIIGIDNEDPSGIAELEKPLHAEYKAGVLNLNGLKDGEFVAVYSMDGRRLGCSVAHKECATISIEYRGIVLVRQGRNVYKLTLK